MNVSSAGYLGGNYAKISINDVPVIMNKNKNNHERGLHIVLFNIETGEVAFSKIFDTYKSSEELENFILTKGNIE